MRALALGLGLVCIGIAVWVLYRSLRNLWRVWPRKEPEVDPDILAVAEEFSRLKKEHAEALERYAAKVALIHHAQREWLVAHRKQGCKGCITCNAVEAN